MVRIRSQSSKFSYEPGNDHATPRQEPDRPQLNIEDGKRRSSGQETRRPKILALNPRQLGKTTPDFSGILGTQTPEPENGPPGGAVFQVHGQRQRTASTGLLETMTHSRRQEGNGPRADLQARSSDLSLRLCASARVPDLQDPASGKIAKDLGERVDMALEGVGLREVTIEAEPEEMQPRESDADLSKKQRTVIAHGEILAEGAQKQKSVLCYFPAALS